MGAIESALEAQHFSAETLWLRLIAMIQNIDKVKMLVQIRVVASG